MQRRMIVALAGAGLAVLLAGGAGWYAYSADNAGAAASGRAPDPASAIPPTAAAEAPADLAGNPATPPQQPRFASDLVELVIVPATAIPAWRGPASSSPCGDLPPVSPEARAVAAQGWMVTAEERAGDYRVVSYVGRAESGTSGTCWQGDGGIALFRAGQLQALVQEKPGTPDQDRPTLLASVDPLDQGGLRIFDGDLLGSPVADLQFAADGSVRITAQAAVDTACQGRARVPRIHGLPINQAREALFRHGWTPVPRPGAEPAGQGFPEMQDCAGTGLGFCNFTYRGAAGELQVTTAGEQRDPPVVGYAVECR